jgi:hypothetical protein
MPPAARIRYLPGLLSQVPDPRKRRGRWQALTGLLAVGIAAVIAGSTSFAAIGQWGAGAGRGVPAALGADRGPAEGSTYRRAFALISPGILGWVLGAWLHARAVQAGRRLVIATGGKAVRGAKGKDGKAPHLVAALAHGIGAVPWAGRRGREEQRDPRRAGPAEDIRRPGRRGHHDRCLMPTSA